MKWTAGFACVLAAQLLASAPVDACGIKLVAKTSTPRKAVARSSNPSRMLLLGTPPHRLERELSAAGHDVEVAPTASAAKKTQYAVIITDPQHADEARTRFAGATVIVRSDDVTADLTSIEKQVARRPVRTDEGRNAVAALTARQPVAAGRGDGREQVGAKDPTAADPTPPTRPVTPVTPPKEPVKEPVKPVVVATNVDKPKPDHGKPIDKPKAPPVAVADTGFHDEFYFGFNSANVDHNSAALTHAVKWLQGNDIHVVVEGYADPTGTPEGNMTLGQVRAESVRDQLVAAGIDAGRIEVISFGDTKLKYGQADSRNRRVAITPKN